jgi:scyllo-inositol 2-dehydrogenase (NADP+)
MTSLNVGLVGFGLAGRTLHAPLIVASGMRIAAVVTRQVEAVHASFPDARVVSSIEALLEVKPLDLVVIASPNRWHHPQALLALNADHRCRGRRAGRGGRPGRPKTQRVPQSPLGQ